MEVKVSEKANETNVNNQSVNKKSKSGDPEQSEKVEPEEVEKIEPTPPPPPPTSGNLVSLLEQPVFPKDLVDKNASGVVELEVTITTEGQVYNVQLIKSSGYKTMDRVAELTIERGWRFESYQQPYLIPIKVRYYADENNNEQIDVSLGEVVFKQEVSD